MSDNPQPESYCPRPGRACIKVAVILITAAVILAGLIFTIEDETLETLKHTLSIGNIVALVLIINLGSFAVFMCFYAAYQWVRRDLKPPRPESRYQDPDED